MPVCSSRRSTIPTICGKIGFYDYNFTLSSKDHRGHFHKTSVSDIFVLNATLPGAGLIADLESRYSTQLTNSVRLVN
jgi:hypothetical protein